MRILHTSDWHLGKKLTGVSRIAEQEKVLSQIASVAKEKAVDLILVAGDIFDTATPSAESEELFFNTLVEMSQIATVLVIAGNHDDADRLAAAKELAKYNGIIIVGGFDTPTRSKKTIDSGDGWLKLRIGSEIANIVVLPYPSDSRTGAEIKEGETFSSRVKNMLDLSADACFDENGCNIVVSHLFCHGGVKAGDERDIELGTAKIIPLENLPSKAHYVALGHIHKYMKLSKERHIYYSGSILQYDFADTQKKCVLIADIDKTGVKSVEPYILNTQSLVRIRCDSVHKGLELLDLEKDKLAELTLVLNSPITQAETKELKSHENLVQLKIELPAVSKSAILRGKAERSDREIFEEFCKAKNQSYDEELLEMFLELLS